MREPCELLDMQRSIFHKLTLKLIAEKLCVVNLSLLETSHLLELMSAIILLSIAFVRVRARDYRSSYRDARSKGAILKDET